MTRLKVRDIQDITLGLHDYDVRLKQMTGASLRQIACRAASVEEAPLVEVLKRIRIAAVPVTTGLGVISGFSDTVAAITAYLGFEAFVTEGRDVAGMAEAVEKGADILFLSDDHAFVAMAPGSKHVVHNSQATGKGFVAALEFVRGGLVDEAVLVLGCGPVGLAATEALLHSGATVALCDINQKRALAAVQKFGREVSERIRIEDTPHPAFTRYELILDATNEGSFIEASHLTARTLVAAPGMPCALTPEAMKEHRGRILHDALEIGTATMAVQAAGRLLPGVGPGGGFGK